MKSFRPYLCYVYQAKTHIYLDLHNKFGHEFLVCLSKWFWSKKKWIYIYIFFLIWIYQLWSPKEHNTTKKLSLQIKVEKLNLLFVDLARGLKLFDDVEVTHWGDEYQAFNNSWQTTDTCVCQLWSVCLGSWICHIFLSLFCIKRPVSVSAHAQKFSIWFFFKLGMEMHIAQSQRQSQQWQKITNIFLMYQIFCEKASLWCFMHCMC